MSEETKTSIDSWFGPDKTRTRRVIIAVKVLDVVESKYSITQEQTWADRVLVLDYDKATDFDIIEFYESVLEDGKPADG